MMATIPSPTRGLSETTIQRFRDHDMRFWLAYDRARDNLSELIGCDGCTDGIAQREAVHSDGFSKPTYEAVNGSSSDAEDADVFYCPNCTATRLAASTRQNG